MAIQIIAQSAHAAGLQDLGTPAVSLSEPACALRGMDVTIAELPECSTGIWECGPGSFRRGVAKGEVMHILAGVGHFKPENGETVHFKAGDSLFFSPETRGVWVIEETIRKLYVMV